MNPKHIVLAYSGGLDTSAALHWLKARYGCRVTAYCADVGQREDWDDLRARARAAGADELVIDDLREHFVRDFMFPALKANASYEHHYLLGTPLARPVIVEGMIRWARTNGADALSHGSTPKGNDQVRFELSAVLLDPALPTIAPWREWDIESREDLLAYCSDHAIPIRHSAQNLFSHDENQLHLTTEGEYLEAIENPFRWEDCGWIVPPAQAPDRLQRLAIGFERGEPVAINGVALGPIALVSKLNQVGGANGVGLQDIIENRINGVKVRGVFENPALVILHGAHRMLECATMNGEVQRLRDRLTADYGDIVYRGLWFSDERRAIQALVDFSQKDVSGHVMVELYKGGCRAAAVASHQSLYSRDLVTLHEGITFSQEDATGFLNTIALRHRVEGQRRARSAEEGATPIPAAWNLSEI
jgi:argininosuccinate synthase